MIFAALLAAFYAVLLFGLLTDHDAFYPAGVIMWLALNAALVAMMLGYVST